VYNPERRELCGALCLKDKDVVPLFLASFFLFVGRGGRKVFFLDGSDCGKAQCSPLYIVVIEREKKRERVNNWGDPITGTEQVD